MSAGGTEPVRPIAGSVIGQLLDDRARLAAQVERIETLVETMTASLELFPDDGLSKDERMARHGQRTILRMVREALRAATPDDYQPAYQDEYQRLWHRDAARLRDLFRDSAADLASVEAGINLMYNAANDELLGSLRSECVAALNRVRVLLAPARPVPGPEPEETP